MADRLLVARHPWAQTLGIERMREPVAAPSRVGGVKGACRPADRPRDETLGLSLVANERSGNASGWISVRLEKAAPAL